ncbi:hypothetical protein P7D66_08460 [Enterococcus avium]|uniref:hypothetical protein n=1 Tax=Enterococcus avium TaxID=33945 RepID=UPI00288CDD11|nr:hypothetical protein [Enterococcus avium]MDT2422409.1 hypothetical protein [Enterococcus avium]
MAEKAQDKKKETKQEAVVNKESKVRVMAKSNSGAGTTLSVNIEGVPKVIIHGEILELTEKQLQKLKISSSSWSYEKTEKKEDTK